MEDRPIRVGFGDFCQIQDLQPGDAIRLLCKEYDLWGSVSETMSEEKASYGASVSSDPQTAEIAGIVIIEMAENDYRRVYNQLMKIAQDEHLIYRGYLYGHENIKQGFFYLELPLGLWGIVVHWCESALRLELIAKYRYIEADRVRYEGERS